MFERFTDRARRVVVHAQEESRQLNHTYIGTEHILLGIIKEGEGVGAMALKALGVSLEQLRTEVETTIGKGTSPMLGHIPFTPRAKKVLELSVREALRYRHNYIGTEHLLLALIREGEGVGARALTNTGITLDQARDQVIRLLADARQSDEQAWEVEIGSVDRPRCARCNASLEEALGLASIEVAGGDESRTIGVAFCTACGAALGALSD